MPDGPAKQSGEVFYSAHIIPEDQREWPTRPYDKRVDYVGEDALLRPAVYFGLPWLASDALLKELDSTKLLLHHLVDMPCEEELHHLPHLGLREVARWCPILVIESIRAHW